ncbi:ricin-type beta-trefoil lectin domain protein [Streptomyces sp. NPDC060184]|uniref:ricin-type beta-trefoil lectin domain protein n=1 Tax=Streptomyces sp. NPDC060184 TaxID=3347064 RepID=UPI003660493F
MKSPDPPRPARAAPASTPVTSVAAPRELPAAADVPPLPTESVVRARTSAGTSDGRKESNEEKTKKSGAPSRADSAASPASLLAPRGFRRRADTATRTGTESGSGAEAAIEPGPDGAVQAELGPEASRKEAGTAPATGSDVRADVMAGTRTASTAAPVTGRKGARALLRGSHRTVLTVAAVTGVVLVAGVLVGLRGGGSAHDTAAPEAAASMLEAGADGGARVGLPGVLPLPTGHESGRATPGVTPAAAVGGKDDNKHDASGADKGDAHGSSSSSSHDDGKSGDTGGSKTGSAGTSSSSSDQRPTAQATHAPAAVVHSTAPATSGAASSTALSGTMVFSHDSGRCLAVSGGKGRDGSPLEIRDCSTSSAAQRWSIRSDGTIRAFGLCMDAAGASTSNGTVVQLANCNGGPAQQFDLNYRHDLVSSLANRCVDVTGGYTGNGSRLQLWDCNGHDNQKWSRK